MKKLGKRNTAVELSIEAFYCGCNCNSCSARCFCGGNLERAYTSINNGQSSKSSSSSRAKSSSAK